MNYQLTLFGDQPAILSDVAGCIPANYAAVLAAYGLDANRQIIAVRRLGEAARPSEKWFHALCRGLALDAASDGPRQGQMF